MRQAVEQDKTRLVVIDSLTGYLNALPNERFLILHLHELLTYLGQQGVTTLLLMTQHGMANDVRSQQVTLGCGTLILIALIVMFFSRPGLGELEREMRNLRSEVAELKKAIDLQTGQITRLQDKLDKAKGP